MYGDELFDVARLDLVYGEEVEHESEGRRVLSIEYVAAKVN